MKPTRITAAPMPAFYPRKWRWTTFFMKHNRDNHPFGRDMRSLSVSDVLVINRGGTKERLLCGQLYDFKEVKRFLPRARTTPKKEVKQDEPQFAGYLAISPTGRIEYLKFMKLSLRILPSATKTIEIKPETLEKAYRAKERATKNLKKKGAASVRGAEHDIGTRYLIEKHLMGRDDDVADFYRSKLHRRGGSSQPKSPQRYGMTWRT